MILIYTGFVYNVVLILLKPSKSSHTSTKISKTKQKQTSKQNNTNKQKVVTQYSQNAKICLK